MILKASEGPPRANSGLRYGPEKQTFKRPVKVMNSMTGPPVAPYDLSQQ